ncbi:NADPH:quinone oxidoreductase family protein [Pseudactinotalea sp. HY158]|uniref:quinone oxidoreductase family protein n=1 Tax=Pseudactinotalea sp. HY158 TaxID=2654547 RepID=UPI00129CABA7|nr:NADPH:quinone oxidoreductase family protein [Pseudactinotalea sp. HY158]QGH69473.1 zinc-binding dehydrogenase [Pseudactinotalea sp. HY158]
MKAIRIHETGGPDVLRVEELQVPPTGPGTVLIRVGASGVNFTDVLARQGIYMSREAGNRLPHTMGTEAAGVVTGVGDGVDPGLVGTRVVAFVDGGYAEYALADHRLTYPLPDSIDFVDAVAFLVQGVTAWELVHERGAVQPGETVLVHSAAGGVGGLAVQLARLAGAELVIGTAGSNAKLELASALGAHETVNYSQSDWADRVLELTEGRGADLIVEAVGGEIGEQSLRCLGDHGRLIVYGVASKRLSPFAGTQLMQHNQSVTGYWLTSRLAPDSPTAAVVPQLLHLAAEDKLQATIKHVYSLEHAADAHRALANRATVGKVVLVG